MAIFPCLTTATVGKLMSFGYALDLLKFETPSEAHRWSLTLICGNVILLEIRETTTVVPNSRVFFNCTNNLLVFNKAMLVKED